MKRLFIAVIEVDSEMENMDPKTYDSEYVESIIEDGINSEFGSRWKDKWNHDISLEVKCSVGKLHHSHKLELSQEEKDILRAEFPEDVGYDEEDILNIGSELVGFKSAIVDIYAKINK